MTTLQYPLTFTTIYEYSEQIGFLLDNFLLNNPVHQSIANGATACWGMVDSDNLQSVVTNGEFAGTTISQLVQQYPKELVGKYHQANRPFPITIKLLEVTEQLPLTVYPSNTVTVYTKQYKPNMKFWFSLDAQPQSFYVAGVKNQTCRNRFLSDINSPQLIDSLRQFPTLPGDAYFIPNERIHSISAGNLLLELSENVNEGVRISEWGEKHTISKEEQQLAVETMKYQDRQLARICQDKGQTRHSRRIPLLHYCPAFVVDEFRIIDHISDRTTGNSFHIFSVVDGEIEIHTEYAIEKIACGSICCLPATIGEYKIYAVGEYAKALRIKLQNK